MENKYLNEAIIGNKKIIATFTSKGEMQRIYFPSKDNRQYINYFHTGVKINESDLIYLHDDINNTYKQYYDTDTNILNTEIENTYFNLNIRQTDFATIKNNLMSINTYPVTLNTSNVKTSDSWIECNRIGNLVMVNGCVKITKDVNVYTGINLASGAPAPCCDKQLYTGAIAQDNTYSSCLLSVSKNGEINLYVRWKKALAGDVFYYEFCYICK